MAHWATTYIQQTVHVTQRHSYFHQSRQRDLATASLQATIRLFNAARQPTGNVTYRHSYLHQTYSRDMVTAILQRLSGAPSQLIPLVLLTVSLELLGFEIRSRQAISIPKRKVLLVSPLRRLAYRAVDRKAFAISLSPSRQARNGSLLTLSKLHLLSFKCHVLPSL